MSKAEDRAKETYPLRDAEHVYDEERVIEAREYFVEGYHQAEKDLELGWEDIKEICVQSVLVEIDLGGLVSDERHYTEVLKRFKAQKGE